MALNDGDSMGKETVCYSEKRFFEWHEDDKSVNIRASGGSYGGGSEVLVCTKQEKPIVIKETENRECQAKRKQHT